eukprot:11316100-Alexandrium_andersonii.AAC.1
MPAPFFACTSTAGACRQPCLPLLGRSRQGGVASRSYDALIEALVRRGNARVVFLTQASLDAPPACVLVLDAAAWKASTH